MDLQSVSSSRPLVIMRTMDSNIRTSNFKPKCEGKLKSRQAESMQLF